VVDACIGPFRLAEFVFVHLVKEYAMGVAGQNQEILAPRGAIACPEPKRTYVAPMLVHHGEIRQVTTGSISSSGDGGAGKKKSNVNG
jgi:hypothetical protein